MASPLSSYHSIICTLVVLLPVKRCLGIRARALQRPILRHRAAGGVRAHVRAAVFPPAVRGAEATHAGRPTVARPSGVPAGTPTPPDRGGCCNVMRDGAASLRVGAKLQSLYRSGGMDAGAVLGDQVPSTHAPRATLLHPAVQWAVRLPHRRRRHLPRRDAGALTLFPFLRATRESAKVRAEWPLTKQPSGWCV